MKHLLFISILAGFAGVLSAQTDCTNPYDGNSDGAVTITDLLDLLGLFGDSDTDQDGIWDSVDNCTDTSACNYATNPTEVCAYIDVLGICGGECEGDGDGDGICDDVDTCVGNLDECGVCNGPGPTEVVIENITILYDSVYAANIDTWFVYEIGADTTFNYSCLPQCGDPVSYQGYDYATVLIGDQCWFAENLRTAYFNDSTSIPGEWNDNQLLGASFPAQTYYALNPTNLNEFGRLYNNYAANSEKLCPVGWRVPSQADFDTFITFVGDSSNVKLKASSSDQPSWNGSNALGFMGLPAGHFGLTGSYVAINSETRFWLTGQFGSTDYLGPAWQLTEYSIEVDEFAATFGRYYSIRCVQD